MTSSFSTKAVAVILVLSLLIGFLYVTQLDRGLSLCDFRRTSSESKSEPLNLTCNPSNPAPFSPDPTPHSPVPAPHSLSSAPQTQRAACASLNVNMELHMPHRITYSQPSIIKGRTDVVTVTPWLAPIVWESTFDPELLDTIFKPKKLTIAATVFAVGKYVMFLKNFLLTADQFFFVGYNVHIYVFTDRPEEVPEVKMSAARNISVRVVPSSRRWQEISARRMEMVHSLLLEIQSFTHFVFCLDVDSKFHGRWSSESLGDTVAVVHPGYYGDHRSRFPYERRPISRAYMAPSDGDFYYCGGAFGGAVHKVLDMTQICSKNFRDDEKEGVEAAWQEESHLNRFFWDHKPSKVLSPEYLWQDFKPRNAEIHIIRFSGVIKNYAAIRPN